jgi:hypothetical protein
MGYWITIPIMSNITKKQTTLALVAVVFATAMIVGTFATVADNSAFARHHHSSSSVQAIQQNSNTAQTSNVITPGGAGGVTGGAGGAIAAGAGTNTATNSPINSGSNSR